MCVHCSWNVEFLVPNKPSVFKEQTDKHLGKLQWIFYVFSNKVNAAYHGKQLLSYKKTFEHTSNAYELTFLITLTDWKKRESDNSY